MMMSTTNPPMPTLSLATLLRGIGIALVATAATLVALLVLVNRSIWWRGLLAASVVSLIAAAVSILPLAWTLRRGVDQLVGGYFLAGGARAIISLGGCMLAIVVGGYPAAPTLLLMVAYYFAVLGVESGLVAKATWSARG